MKCLTLVVRELKKNWVFSNPEANNNDGVVCVVGAGVAAGAAAAAGNNSCGLPRLRCHAYWHNIGAGKWWWWWW